MPPRPPIRLPRLTLFTGGKECSLCEVWVSEFRPQLSIDGLYQVAKQDLELLRRDTPFVLNLFNIRSPPPDTDEKEAKRWRRLYQYDIDTETPDRSRGPAAYARGMASAPAGRGKEPAGSFQPYQSILKFPSAPARSKELSDQDVEVEKPITGLPPWRRPVGTAYFLLNSEFARLYGEDIHPEEAEQYAALLERTFCNFSEQMVWYDPLAIVHNEDQDVSWTVDDRILRGLIEEDPGDEVMYDEAHQAGPSRPGQLCWNCREMGHAYTDCRLPRNYLQVRASREEFLAAKDAMPEYAIPYLPSGSSTVKEKRRRLELLNRFEPGHVSTELVEAVWYIGDEEDQETREAAEVMIKRGEWPWLYGMLKWGYPPGWIAGKDPKEEVRRRIHVAREKDESDMLDAEDVLQVFGGDLGSFARLATSKPPTPPDSHAAIRIGSRSPAASDMSMESGSSPPSVPNGHPNPRGPPDSPPPLPPSPADSPPPLPAPLPPEGLPSLQNAAILSPRRPTPTRRWAIYETELFSSNRLTAYTGARPLPLGF